VHEGNAFDHLLALEDLAVEETKRGHHLIEEAERGVTVVAEVELIGEDLVRAELVGRKRYLDSLEYAAKVFPNGTVASHLIVGLEPPGSTIQGIDFLTNRGVVPILPIYRPSRGRALRIEPLNAEIIIPVYKHLYRALTKEKINFKWVRDISMVTTPVEGRLLLEGEKLDRSLLDAFYRSRIGLKTAWGLSTLRRKLRVKEVKEDPHKKK